MLYNVHMPIKSNSFNIAIVPSEAVTGRAISISKKLKRDGGIFVLNKRLYSSHITIYMTKLPLRSLNEVSLVLRQLAATIKSIKLTGLDYHQHDGWVDVEYRRNKAIQELQKKIIKSINPFRQNLLRASELERLPGLPKQQAQYVKKYGYRGVFKYYRPHLTLTRLKSDKDVISQLKKENFDFTANEIGIFYLGEYGSCKKMIAKFKLG